MREDFEQQNLTSLIQYGQQKGMIDLLRVKFPSLSY